MGINREKLLEDRIRKEKLRKFEQYVEALGAKEEASKQKRNDDLWEQVQNHSDNLPAGNIERKMGSASTRRMF